MSEGPGTGKSKAHVRGGRGLGDAGGKGMWGYRRK